MNKKLFWFLIVILVFGLFLRVYELNSQRLIGDEHAIIIGSMKFAHSSFRDGVSYLPDNPPFGRLILSIPSFLINGEYYNLPLIPPTSFIFSYTLYEEISKNYIPMKLIAAFFGILSILFIYLISKELFDNKAAIWSAVLSAIAFDLIIYSRIIYMPVFIVFFSLGTIYFFLKYLKSKLKIRYLYLSLVYLFLFFAVGSHHVQPWFLIPVLIASQFLFNRKLREDILVSVGYLLTFGLMWFIYNSYIYVIRTISMTYNDVSTGFFGTMFDFINFTFHDIILGFLLRNNYVLSLVSLICVFVFFKLLFRKKLFGKIKEMVVSKDLRLILVMLFVVSFIGLGFTSLGDEMRHLIFLFIPLYIFSGFVVKKIVKKKWVFYLVILLLLVSVVQGVYNSPSSIINYSNFGISSYQAEHYDDRVDKEVLDYLEGLGNPVIMTNHLNTLIFYNEDKGALITNGPICNVDFFYGLKEQGVLILYYGELDKDENIKLSRNIFKNFTYFCGLFEEIKFDKLKRFDENLILYKIA